MARLDKLVGKLCQASPPKDLTWDEAIWLLRKCGFTHLKRKGTSKGSHFRFQKPDGGVFNMSMPHPGKELKAYQVRALREVLIETGCIDDPDAET